jgi:hypothetical protein
VQIPRADLELREQLGHGQFGRVFAAVWKQAKVVVKELKESEDPKARARAGLRMSALRACGELAHTVPLTVRVALFERAHTRPPSGR